MSAVSSKRVLRQVQSNAPLFAALGDETRLTLLTRLTDGTWLSITQLSDGATISRQAVTKHLRILENAGLVRGTRRGRESLFQLEPRALTRAQNALESIARQWDEALLALQKHVEGSQGLRDK